MHAYAEEHPEQAYKGINEAVRFDQRGSEISTTSRSARVVDTAEQHMSQDHDRRGNQN